MMTTQSRRYSISPCVILSVITTIASRMTAPSGLLFTSRAQKMPTDGTDTLASKSYEWGRQFDESPSSFYIQYVNCFIEVIFFSGLLSSLLACNRCCNGSHSFRLSLKLDSYASVSSGCAKGLLLLLKIREIIWPLSQSPSEKVFFKDVVFLHFNSPCSTHFPKHPFILTSSLIYVSPLLLLKFKYRGLFLPVSPLSRRVLRFAARRKVSGVCMCVCEHLEMF